MFPANRPIFLQLRALGPAPILLPLPPHGRCVRVLTLNPVPRAAGDIGRAESLRHDPLIAELAGMAENNVARLHDVFIQFVSPFRHLAGF